MEGSIVTDTPDRLMEARCRLLTLQPWYGHICMGLEWLPDEMSWLSPERRTMGVRIMSCGKVQCLYYEPFLEGKTLRQLYGFVQHEIEHLVRLHLVRIGSRDPELWNICCDAVVNGHRASPRIGYTSDHGQYTPPSDGMIWLPQDYPEGITPEELYDRFSKGPGNPGGNTLDDHQIWRQSEVSEDEARQVVSEMCTAVSSRVGSVPSHLAEIIKSLDKPIVHWQEYLKRYIGRHVGNRRLTYSRQNRRRDWFGIKGISHHACATVTIIVDTSGSVSMKQLQSFFAEIEHIAHRCKVSLLLWDAGFQGFSRYKRGQWKGFRVTGRGGTDREAPVQWLEENNGLSDLQIMLTDGEVSGWPTQRGYPFIFVIANNRDTKNFPAWGHLVKIKGVA